MSSLPRRRFLSWSSVPAPAGLYLNNFHRKGAKDAKKKNEKAENENLILFSLSFALFALFAPLR